MTLAQAVLEIFCSQSSIGLQWESRKKMSKRAVTLQRQVRRKSKKKNKQNKQRKNKQTNTGPFNFRTYSTHKISKEHALV